VHKTFNVSLRITCDTFEIEAIERGAKVFTFSENRDPCHSSLKTFKTDFLEQTSVVNDGDAQFLVMVFSHVRSPEAVLELPRIDNQPSFILCHLKLRREPCTLKRRALI
jgi:hypothetical protein